MSQERAHESLAGRLLLSHPSMRHDAFRHTVVLIAAHDANGAMGVILNRPLGKTVSEANANFDAGALGHIALYDGGPVGERQLIFAGWHWSPPEGNFHLHFGLSKERVEDIAASDPGVTVRAFLGHSGWAPGQLENELQHNGWAVTPMDHEFLRNEDGENLWRALLNKHHPTWRLLAEAPDTPEFN